MAKIAETRLLMQKRPRLRLKLQLGKPLMPNLWGRRLQKRKLWGQKAAEDRLQLSRLLKQRPQGQNKELSLLRRKRKHEATQGEQDARTEVNQSEENPQTSGQISRTTPIQPTDGDEGGEGLEGRNRAGAQ